MMKRRECWPVILVTLVAVMAAMAMGPLQADPAWTVPSFQGNKSGLDYLKVHRSTIDAAPPPTALAPAIGLLTGDVIDAISFGDDALSFANKTVYFSVGFLAQGLTGTAVCAQQYPTGNGVAGDVFLACPLTSGTNRLKYDAPRLQLKTEDRVNPPLYGDDISSLQFDYPTTDGLIFPIYFSLKRDCPTLAAHEADGWTGADIFVATAPGSFGRYLSAGELGLDDDPETGDDIDGLALQVPSEAEGAEGIILFSLTADSKACQSAGDGGLGYSPTDILTPMFSNVQRLYLGRQLGLRVTGDNLDAFDVFDPVLVPPQTTLPVIDRYADTFMFGGETDLLNVPDVVAITQDVRTAEVELTVSFLYPVAEVGGGANAARMYLYLDTDQDAGTGQAPAIESNVSDYGELGIGVGAELRVDITASGLSNVVQLPAGTPLATKVKTVYDDTEVRLTFYLPDWDDAVTYNACLETQGMKGAQWRYRDLTPEVGHFTLTLPQEPARTVSFDEAAMAVAEDAGTKRLMVRLNYPDSQATVSVDYAFAKPPSTADRPDDFTMTDGTFQFAPGETTKSITVKIEDDTLAENDETIVIALSNPQGAVLGPNPNTRSRSCRMTGCRPSVSWNPPRPCRKTARPSGSSS